jgi:hypothetical protein
MLTRWRQANVGQREHERALYGRNPSYGNFLRAIRDQPGFGFRIVALCAAVAALSSQGGFGTALTIAGYALLGCATLGYRFWRWRLRGR